MHIMIKATGCLKIKIAWLKLLSPETSCVHKNNKPQTYFQNNIKAILANIIIYGFDEVQ